MMDQERSEHVEVIHKIDEIYWEYCVSSWFHLQDFKTTALDFTIP